MWLPRDGISQRKPGKPLGCGGFATEEPHVGWQACGLDGATQGGCPAKETYGIGGFDAGVGGKTEG